MKYKLQYLLVLVIAVLLILPLAIQPTLKSPSDNSETITLPQKKVPPESTRRGSSTYNSNSTVYYEVRGDAIYMVNITTGEEKPIHLFGVNWFGFETPDHVVHGLWARNWEDMLVQIKELGFNAIRLPFCTESVRPGTMPSTIDYTKNPDLQGLTSVEIMEKIVEKAGELGIFILLDYHRIGCQYIEPLWYTDSFTEQDYIDTWVSVAQRFSRYWNVIGADLKNEPHSVSQPPSAYTDGTGATWGMGNNATDWNLAAERIGKAILEVAPHWLIFVEGTQYTRPDIDGSYQWGYNTWWGGNLMAVRDYPVNLPRNKLVYSPHVYGPDVYNQPYFNEPDFPDNMPEIWYTHFGYVKIDLGYPIVIGEFGGRYGHGGDPRDVDWQNKLIDWMIENNFCSFFYWSWNPNSGDTGGILKDDWTSIWEDKYANLKRLMDHCSHSQAKGAIGAYYLQNLDPGKIEWHYWRTLILEPDEANDTIINIGKNNSDTLLAYLNIGYAEEWRSYWTNISGEDWVHGATEYEGEYYVEYWKPEWHDIMKYMAEQYVSLGFEGVYLDNVDASEIIDYMNPPWAEGVDTYSEMIELVCNISTHIKSLNPATRVYINIGGAYSLLYNNTLSECIDGVLREELWSVWSGYNQTQPQDPVEANATLDALIYARDSGKEVLVVDPVTSGEEAYNFCRASWNLGFIPIPQPAWAPDYDIPPLEEWCVEPSSNRPDNTSVFSLYVDFDDQELGLYTDDDLVEDFIDINWSRLDGRAEIVEEGGDRYLRVEYPAGEAGSRNSGVSFVVNLPESRYCTLEYMVRFEEGFDFSKGGKLPGLTSGGSYWTGFRVPENGEGWSARYMWRGDRTPGWGRDYNRSDASLFLYLYWMGQERSYGDYISLNYTVVPGVWYSLKQEIYVGNPGEANAYIRVYINGSLALDMSNIQLWGEGYNALIDSFYFSTFFGGKGSSWAPDHTVYADFDDINITCINVQGEPPSNPPQVSLIADRTIIAPGEAVNVTWSISGAEGWISNIPGAGLPGVDLLVLSPLEDELYRVEEGVGSILGYVSITTIGGWEPWAVNVTDDMIIGYTSWGDAVVNASDPRWHDIIIREAIPYIVSKGFNGVLFDNLDQVDAYPGIRDGVVSLIEEARQAYPDILIAVNRGFSIISQIAGSIDIVLFEAYGSYYDFQEGVYKPYTGQDLEWINQTLQDLMSLSRIYGFSVLGLAYGDPSADGWSEIIDTVCSLNEPYGNPVYIADVYLQEIGVVNPCGGEEGSFIVYYGRLGDAMSQSGSTILTPVNSTTLYIYAWNAYGGTNTTLEITVTVSNGSTQCSSYITISYPEEQWPTAEIDLDGDGVNEYIIEINPWNIESADGYAVMTYCIDDNTIHYEQALDNIILRNPGSWVHGYPEVFYGNKPWNQYSATDGPVPLPGRLSELNNFYVTVSYELNPEPSLPVNLAIESWLTRDQWRTNGVNPDEQEIMIWLYYNGLQPAGSMIGEITVPIIVNGTLVNATFEVWKAFIGWEYIAFRITTPMKAATVTLPYAPFISTAANVTDLIDYASLYLEDVEVGTEYGSPSITSAHMEWYIYTFNLTYTSEPLITVPPPPPPGGGREEGGATSGSLSVELVNSWGSGAQYDVDITLDNPDNWILKVKVADGSITNSWGAYINGTEDGYTVLVAEEWNKGPNANVGFITSGDNPLVTEILLVVNGEILDNWTAPQPNESSMEVELVIDSEWNTGFVARIYITNNGDTPISGWYVKIYMTSNITSIWGATYEELDNHTIVLRPVGYTSVIDPGETIELGFVAEKHGDHPLPVIIDYGIEDNNNSRHLELVALIGALLLTGFSKNKNIKQTIKRRDINLTF